MGGGGTGGGDDDWRSHLAASVEASDVDVEMGPVGASAYGDVGGMPQEVMGGLDTGQHSPGPFRSRNRGKPAALPVGLSLDDDDDGDNDDDDAFVDAPRARSVKVRTLAQRDRGSGGTFAGLLPWLRLWEDGLGAVCRDRTPSRVSVTTRAAVLQSTWRTWGPWMESSRFVLVRCAPLQNSSTSQAFSRAAASHGM